MLYIKTIFTQYFSLIFITSISFCSIAQLTPNGNSGSSTTVYTNGASNNPIYIWCADGLLNNTASLTANAPTGSGPFTYSWFFHDQSNFSWSPYFTQTGTSSTISNLPSDGYRVQIYNAGGNLVACYIAWVWNMNSDVTANNTPTACNASNLSGAVSVNGAFSYYNPPPPESLINASTQITVCFSANHTYVSDLGFYLVGPAACGSPTIAVMPHPELINASNNCCCNSGDNLSNLCFTTNPLGNINPCSAVVPLNGTYSGYSSSFGNNVTINWSSLFGCNAAEGGWRVQIYDCIAADVGALTNASITFSNLTSICGSPTSITYSSGAINSIINDNSCTAASASIFQVPITPNLTTPITINAATTYLWTANQTVVIPNASSSLNTSVATIPNGTTNFTLTATISYGSTVCTNSSETVVTVNPNISPTFTEVGPFCSGAIISPLSTNSSNGISGTWAPAINNTSTTTYTFTPSAGECASTSTMSIEITPNIPPSFPQVGPYCLGATIPPLTTISTNGFSGTWLPEINNTATTTYTFTPATGQCATNQIMSITIDPSTTTGSVTTTICEGSSYTWPANGLTYTTAQNGLSFVTGCNTATLNLNLLPNVINAVVDTACGEYLFGTNLLDISGIYVDTFLTINNCDSIVTLDLTIFEDSSVTYITACDSAQWNGVWYYNDTTVTTTGLYTSIPFGGSTVNSSGQEGNIWYFGNNAGITFETNPPSALNNGAISTFEGCATFSDNQGNLLFYTDGMFVYNKLHQQMPNGFGLLGNPSSAQSGVIVPKPGSQTDFYIFTVDAEGGSNGFRYSEVDMTLDGGLGDVINPSKNTLLFAPSAEKVAAVAHANGVNYWVISHGINNNSYYAYLIDFNGINNPVISNVGQIESNPGWGYLASSIDGTKLASAMCNQGFELLDFNNQTGEVSNPILLNNPGSAYGISFSPNSQILYGCEITGGQIYQWDLNAGSSSSIISSMQVIGTGQGSVGGYKGGAIQQGRDGKLYIPHFNQPYLSCINNPNQLGNGCNLQHFAIDLQGNNAQLGLPTFFSSIFESPPAGCDSVATAIITITPTITPTFTPVGPYCIGEAIPDLSLTSTNGIIGAWSPAIDNMATTTYTFTPDAGQCALTQTLIITIFPNTIPTFAAVGPYCTGEAIADLSLTSTNGISGTWSPAIDNTATTTYTFTPTSSATPTCATTAGLTITITPNTTPIFSAVGPYCSGAIIPNLPLTSTNGISGAWSPAIDNTATTTYTFTPTSSATPTCATTAALTITIFPNTIPTFAAVGPYCTGQVIADLSLTSSNGINGTWSPAIDNTATTTYTFTPTSTATPTPTCATTAALTITIFPNTIPTFAAVGPYCSGVIIPNLPLTSTNGISGDWSPVIDNTATTTYTFSPTSTATPICATTVAATISINTNTIPTFAAVGPYCSGAIIPNLPLTSTNGISGAWSPAIDNTATTTYTFTPTSSATPTCGTTASLTITINTNTTPIFDPVGPYCSGAIIPDLPLTSANGITGTWSPAINNTATTTYTFTPTSTASPTCATTAALTIIINPNPTVSFIPGATIGCLPFETSLTNTTPNAQNCVWTISNGIVLTGCGSIPVIFSNDGCFDVTLTTTVSNGCTSSLTMNNLICVENNPIASFSISTNDLSILNTEVLFDNTSTGANTYQWYFGVNDAESSLENPIFTFPNDYENSQYEVVLIAISTIGCTDTAETIIQINEELLFYIPNTFTPDGDVYNQTFKPVFTSGFDPYNYEMLIFNRWGEILFETHDVTYGWDGKYALKNCQEGIYSYKITFKNPILDERKVVCGSINLLK